MKKKILWSKMAFKLQILMSSFKKPWTCLLQGLVTSGEFFSPIYFLIAVSLVVSLVSYEYWVFSVHAYHSTL